MVVDAGLSSDLKPFCPMYFKSVESDWVNKKLCRKLNPSVYFLVSTGGRCLL